MCACLPSPQRSQTNDLLDRLSTVHSKLAQSPPTGEPCVDIGDVETRLYGEPGLADVQPAWSELTTAAHALQAVCGENALLAQPSTGSAARAAADARWSEGAARELQVACTHLRAAATALNRPAPC